MGQKLDAQIHSGEEEEPVRSGEKEIQEAGEKSATCNSFLRTFVDQVFQHITVTILGRNT